MEISKKIVEKKPAIAKPRRKSPQKNNSKDFRDLFEKMQKDNKIDINVYRDLFSAYKIAVEELNKQKLSNERRMKRLEELKKPNKNEENHMKNGKNGKNEIIQKNEVFFDNEKFSKPNQNLCMVCHKDFFFKELIKVLECEHIIHIECEKKMKRCVFCI